MPKKQTQTVRKTVRETARKTVRKTARKAGMHAVPRKVMLDFNWPRRELTRLQVTPLVP
jgi:hypothetical protein